MSTAEISRFVQIRHRRKRNATPYELGIILMMPELSNGTDDSVSAGGAINEDSSRFRFTSMGGKGIDCNRTLDGVCLLKGIQQSEYENPDFEVRSYLHSAHELAHNFGAFDLYDQTGNNPVAG